MRILANVLILISVFILSFIFWPVAKEEIKYSLDRAAHVKYVVGTEQLNTFEKPLTPVNTDFSIIIPKIAAVAPIVDNIDPGDPNIYLPALRKGVAHALGTANPGDWGNVYIFAHSTDAFYNVGRYNAVFYLLGKLSKGDEIYIYYKDGQYKYIVDAVKVVSPSEVNYSAGNPDTKTLTIQTGYPAGTAFKRLIVIANEAETQ